MVSIVVATTWSANAATTYQLLIDSDQSLITDPVLANPLLTIPPTEQPSPIVANVYGTLLLTILDEPSAFFSYNAILTGELLFSPGIPNSNLFIFDTLRARIIGNNITGSNDPCAFSLSACMSVGAFNGFTGTFDGQELNVVGFQGLEVFSSNEFEYNLDAVVVPIPPAILTFMSAILWFVGLCGVRNITSRPS